jgi:hypothetical protein
MRYKRRHDTEQARTFAYLFMSQSYKSIQSRSLWICSFNRLDQSNPCLFVFFAPIGLPFGLPFHQGKRRLIEFLRDHRPFLSDPREVAFHLFCGARGRRRRMTTVRSRIYSDKLHLVTTLLSVKEARSLSPRTASGRNCSKWDYDPSFQPGLSELTRYDCEY